VSRWIYDIETDGLYNSVTRMWILAAYNIDTREMKYWLEGDTGWKDAFADATLIVGHNILGFDNAVLKKLYNFEFPKGCNFHDTLIISRVLDYRRFGDEGHGLKVWGKYLEFPKLEFEDWSQYSEEMRLYCLQDVRLNVVVYDVLLEEFMKLAQVEPKIKTYLQAEHAVAKWCTLAHTKGWPFDLPRAKQLESVLKKELDDATAILEPKLGRKVKIKQGDKKYGEIQIKRPKWIKAGCYDQHTANYFGVDPWSGFEGEERPIWGEFCRIEVHDLQLSSTDDVKLFLSRNGWQPDEWNYKWCEETRKKIQTSPKITESSLEFLGGDGKLYKEYLTAGSRYGVLTGWIDATDEQGFLHGECHTIGTPSMRARHSIIVNVPAGESKWGKEMRELFGTMPGWKLIGCDSAGNQARGLAHYLEDPVFIDTLLNGDIHTFNANKIDEVLTSMGISWTDWIIEKGKCEIKEEIWHNYGSITEYLKNGIEEDVAAHIAKAKRARAKRILYAFLFGAGGDKLWSYIFDVLDKQKGNKFKNGFQKAVPGFKALMEKLENIFGATKKYADQGYIPSLAGNKIYVDSFHKLLVYLLQSAEKITCSAACMLLMQWLEEEGIPYHPCIMMHDELDFMVPEQYAERAAELGVKAFQEGPKLFGVQIMDGGKKIGNNWYEVH
jgi:DNA polymerase-1